MILAIYGTGGAGKETLQVSLDIKRAGAKWQSIVFIDDTKPTGKFKGYEMLPYVEFKEKYGTEKVEIHVALGEVSSKRTVAQKMLADGYQLATLVHPRAHIGKNVVIHPGAQIKMEAVIGDNAVIGIGSWIQAYTIIADSCRIGAFCQIGAKAVLGENCCIGDTVFVGMHAVISNNIEVQEDVIVGMGAWVNQDLQSYDTCIGNPCRVVSKDKNHRVFG